MRKHECVIQATPRTTGTALLGLILLLSWTAPWSVARGDELPEPPEPRADTRGNYLSPYLGNDTLAPWVGNVMARKLDIDFREDAPGGLENTLPAGEDGITNARDLAAFLSSERPAGLEEEVAAMERGMEAMEDIQGDVKTGMKLMRLLRDGDSEEIMSRLGQEVTSAVADEAFDEVAEEMGAFSGLLAPIREAAEQEAVSSGTRQVRFDISEFRSQADRSFDSLDAMLVHTVVFYRHRDDFQYSTEAILQTYPQAGSRMEPAMSRAAEIIHAEVNRMSGAEKYDIQWVDE